MLQIKTCFNPIRAGGKSRFPEGFSQNNILEVGGSLSSTEAEETEGIGKQSIINCHPYAEPLTSGCLSPFRRMNSVKLFKFLNLIAPVRFVWNAHPPFVLPLSPLETCICSIILLPFALQQTCASPPFLPFF